MDGTGFVINEFVGPAVLPGNRIVRLCDFVFHTSYFIISQIYGNIVVSIIAQLSVHSCAEQSS